jgi:REP element-mobilizing transposase RayT
MSRPLRIELAGGLYHVTSRGNRREDIYLDDDDRETWLALFEQVCQRFNWRCHAYCLMSNHYHIVVETIEGNLSKGMRQLNGVYTQYFNRHHGRVGHVFQGRYKGILVEKDSYLLELSRYVVLNPVRAGMVNDAVDWPWSSYRAMVGQAVPPSWLETTWLLRQFSKQRKRAVAKYTDFVRAGVGIPAIWENLSQQIYLGDERFVKRLQKKLVKDVEMSEVPRAQRRPKAKPLEHYEQSTRQRDKGMLDAYYSGGYTMKEIAEHFGVHYSTVSRAIRKNELRQCK